MLTARQKLKVLMIPSGNSGVAYWRMYNPWVGLHRQDLADCRVLWWRKDIVDALHPWQLGLDDAMTMVRITQEMNAYARTADVIVIQGVQTPAALALFYALKDAYPRTPILTEMDDDVTWTPAEHPASQSYSPFSGLTHTAIQQIKQSDGLIVSTPWLAEVYGEHNDRIEVVPNAIDFNVWGKAKGRSRPGIRIGWAGGASHAEDLRLIEPAIRELTAKNRNVRFVFVHCCPDFLRSIPGVEAVDKWARIDHYPKFLAGLDFDIGLAPLVDNLFNRCKSNLRWLEYSALGIPTVASNVGHFKQTLRNGQDALLADKPEDFAPLIQSLIDDAKARRALGRRAKDRVVRDFNVDTVAKHYAEVLERFVEQGTSKEPLPMSDAAALETAKIAPAPAPGLVDAGPAEARL